MAAENDEAFLAMRARLAALLPRLNERDRRAAMAAEATSWGRGGISAVHRATGASRTTIRRGMAELADDEPPRDVLSRDFQMSHDIRVSEPRRRVRAPGAGRKKAEVADPKLLDALDSLVEPQTRGDPEPPLRWTTKSTRNLAGQLTAMGHRVSHSVVAKILGSLGYSLQRTRKTLEGRQHPDRDAQFRYINGLAEQFLTSGDPVISVDTKKKELAGQYVQASQERQPTGEPVEASTCEFPGEQGKAPYGVYDLADDSTWASAGVDHDTSVFAVATIEKWWHTMGKHKYPNTRRILITADGGGSNRHHHWLWKFELARLARATGLDIIVCHYPPGTSKWNKIEHRLFSRITHNWRGRSLDTYQTEKYQTETYQTVVNLITNTTTTTGLAVHCEIDSKLYPTELKITDQQKESIPLARHKFHGDWNYTIPPSTVTATPGRWAEPARCAWSPASELSLWRRG